MALSKKTIAFIAFIVLVLTVVGIIFAVSLNSGSGLAPVNTSAPVNTIILTTGSNLSTTCGASFNLESYLQSPNGLYRLYLQNDGNLAIYNTSDWSNTPSLWTGIWDTQSSCSNASSVRLLIENGSAVIYNNNSTLLWTTDTGGSNGTKLVLQNDSNLVLYNDDRSQSYWSSWYGKS